MVSFSAKPLVADDPHEDHGQFYTPHRGRQTARGANGRFYTLYGSTNASNGIIRCVCWEANALGDITTHWDFKVGDAGFGTGVSDAVTPYSFQVAIDNNGTTERVIAAWTDYVSDTMKFAYTSTASPAAFTAGDSFSLKDPAYTTQIGFDLFGRPGSGVIVIVYGNADAGDVGTTNYRILSRTLSTHSGTWSSSVTAYDPNSVLLVSGPFSDDFTSTFCRRPNGDLRGVVGGGVSLGTALDPLGLFEITSITPFSSFSVDKLFGSMVFGAVHRPLSMCVDSADKTHLVYSVISGATMTLRYFRADIFGVVEETTILETVTFANTQTSAYRFFRSASISVDQYANPHIVAMLRSNPVTGGTTPSSGLIEGQTIYYRKNPSATWDRYLVTNRRDVVAAATSGTVRTVNSQSMPYDCSVVGKMGYQAAGAMWVEVACHNVGSTGTFDFCDSPGHQRRIIMTDDWEPGLTRRGRNAMLGAQANTTQGPKYNTAQNALSMSQGATHPGSTLPRTGANALAVNGSTSGGKGKTGQNFLFLAHLATFIADTLSKWTGRNVLDFAQTPTSKKVVHRLAQNFINFIGAIAKFGAGANELTFSQSVTVGGDVRVFAENEVDLTNAAVFDPVETCETNYNPIIPIPADPESHLFVSITAPASAPVKTITLRRPELGNEDSLAMQGELSRAQSGAARSTIRTPNPISWSATFTGLTRKQVIELEDFFVSWRGNRMIYRDHNNWRWLVYVLTDKPTCQSQGPENWFLTLEFTGTPIVE